MKLVGFISSRLSNTWSECVSVQRVTVRLNLCIIVALFGNKLGGL